MEDTLFPIGTPSAGGPSPADPAAGVPRVRRAIRNQVEMLCADLDSLLPADHQARNLWAFVERADLSDLYEQIRALEGGAGRPATDPRILLCLWMYATADGVGSARELAELCADNIVYRWICGGVPVNFHTLADFRSLRGATLDELLTDSIAALTACGLVTLNRVAHDGLRVRADAGSGSFRREGTLQRHREEAEAQVAALKRELGENPGASRTRSEAARERAARERLERVNEALRQYPDAQKKKKKDKENTRVSSTDPDARVMRMADGGFRPAYNVQMSVDTASQIIVGVGVSQSGSDYDLQTPAIAEIENRNGLKPAEILLDGGFANPVAIQKAEAAGITVYAPPIERKDCNGHPINPAPDEPSEVKAWRERMKTPEAQEIYRERASTIECVNAHARNRGLQQFPVRGLKKVLAVSLLFALVHNVLRAVSLRRPLAVPSG